MLPSELLPLLGIAVLGWIIAKTAGSLVRNLFQWVFFAVTAVVLFRHFPDAVARAEHLWTQLLPVIDSAASIATSRLADLIHAAR